MNLSDDEIASTFVRQVRLCCGLGAEKMHLVIDEHFGSDARTAGARRARPPAASKPGSTEHAERVMGYCYSIDDHVSGDVIRDLLAERRLLRETLEQLAAQSSGVAGSTARADCMAALARAALLVRSAS